MKNIRSQKLGKIGENYTTIFLEKKGYKIIIRNFRCRHGEIDIIAKDENEYVFIEVKTRSTLKYGRPAEAVDFLKKQHICKVAKYFLYKYRLQNISLRFDVVEVFFHKNTIYMNHLKNVSITS